jgi:dolichol-phosphate mannosyltransferase
MADASYDLTIVMPVYNEQDAIEGVVREWMEELRRLQIRVEFRLYNDGSRDQTAERLENLKKFYPELTAVNKPNEGHGPTILRGYREAAAPWIFQTDSDGEMPASSFAALWDRRNDYDALFGIRAGRAQNLGRKLISFVSRRTVAILFGKGVVDVNTPYRLIRASLLKPIVSQIPLDTFAPNVIISGALARAKARISNQPVPHQGRKSGTVSIVKWKLWKAAFRSFWQTVRCRPKIARPPAE